MEKKDTYCQTLDQTDSQLKADEAAIAHPSLHLKLAPLGKTNWIHVRHDETTQPDGGPAGRGGHGSREQSGCSSRPRGEVGA